MVVSAPVMEVFASIQGEGAYVGEPQVFLRLRGCPMRCAWCDTPGSWTPEGESVRVDATTGARKEDAWASPFQVACWIAECEPAGQRTVSVTGGEPLVWPEFLLALRTLVGERRMHLETAGGHPETLARVIDAFQHVSLDLKLPKDLDEPVEWNSGAEPSPRDEKEWAAARRACLEQVADRDACAKIVVAGGRSVRDYEALFEDVARIAPHLPVFVQPATSAGGVAAPDIALCTEVAEEGRDLDLVVRVIPQVHRALRIP